MSKNDNRTPSYKPEFTLTVLSHESLSESLSLEINNAIGTRVSYRECGETLDKITNTYRYVYTFSPVSLEKCKRSIQNLASRHSSELTIFFDENKTFGIRKFVGQIQIAFDLIVGVILPTEATILIQTSDDQQIKNIQKSLNAIFFNGNNSNQLNEIKKHKGWCKTSFKVTEPIRFKNNFEDFRKQNKDSVIFGDTKRKKITSYIPYLGLTSVLLNIAYFREHLLDYVDQLIMACYDLIKS